MKTSIKESIKTAITMFVLGILPAMLAVSLFYQKRYFPMVGWLMLLALLLLIACFALWSARFVAEKDDLKSKSNGSRVNAIQSKNEKDYVLLTSTNDWVKVQAITDHLKNNGIKCVVLDQHSTTMMRFIPEVEMRVMVSTEDYESSLKIIKDAFV